eukprot:g4317.t1
MSKSVSISFDEECRIRVLESEDFNKTRDLELECKNYVTKLTSFNDVVTELVEKLNSRARAIEKVQLQAIGQRNICESEQSNRKRKKSELKRQISEKMEELERYSVELESLEKVEKEQLALIEKISSSDC